ncbi:MAG: CRISPR-associated endonuclease Cas2 [Ignavibacteriota bacterium]|jgi:CRISPR-associated protein Cas2|nr:CRISPR-associated endonuclease Cas2 [Ignavibacteriales bacterium]MBL1121452.1 CRISPR-associated endonuclease Cas2 [Ignavibacteriota bacterium]MCE7857043.1 CRISPR-associated endonuclease Cas2 [Ignavibacteria bacterium CHB3]MCL4279042.1 CRISPR-associated endonuclease Cas2 [Ignavibacteriaceae bacterium]QKJ97150.1 MAG: CRISPR-associated endonuclease Cas2 [Ignavibacteriota bacterium]
MMVVVSYDVSTATKSGKKRLNKVAKTCLDFGIRAQNSVFECIIDPAQWEILKNELLSIYKPEEDNLKFYYLGSNYQRRIESFGKSKSLNIEDALIL